MKERELTLPFGAMKERNLTPHLGGMGGKNARGGVKKVYNEEI